MMLWIILLVATVLIGLVVLVALRQRRGDIVTLAPHQQLPADLDMVIAELLTRGQKIAAVKLVRERTNTNLRQAKAYVDRLEMNSTSARHSDARLAAAQEAMQRGDSIQAIKLVRAATGLGLKEAKAYVERWPAQAAPAFPPAPDTEQAARALLAQGNTLAAIKLVLEQTGMGLRDAKNYVESL